MTSLTLVLVGVFIHKWYLSLDGRVPTIAFDGREYHVRDTLDKKETADSLARLNENIIKIINYMERQNDPNFVVATERLKSRYNVGAISEGIVEDGITSYTVNKGEQIVFCMRTRDEQDTLYKDNILLYVAMHELAHIMSISEQHTPEFYKNFDYIQQCAKAVNLFQHSSEPINYCGLKIARI